MRRKKMWRSTATIESPKQNPGWFPNTEFGFSVQHVEYHDDNDGTNADTDHPVLVVLVVVVIFLILMVLFGTRFLLGFTRFLDPFQTYR